MDRRRPALLPAVVALVGVVLLIVWGGAAVAVEDAFWFLPVFSSDAARIELYWDGGHVRLLPGSAEYALLNEAVRADLPHVRAYPEKVGLSDGMLERLRVRGRLVEVHYAEPVRIHSRYRFGSSTVFYIPLSGPHAAQNRVFNRGRGAPLELESAERIRAAAEAVARQEGLSGP